MVPKKGGILVGFREPGSSYITSLQDCLTLDPRISSLLPALHELIPELSNHHRIPQVEVAAGDDDIAMVFRHLEELTVSDLEYLAAFGRDHSVQVFSQSAGPDSVTAIWPKSPRDLAFRILEFDLVFDFAPTDFIQVNAVMNQKMVSRAIGFMEPEAGDRILDLFCGLGNFSLALARKGAVVLGVEGDGNMVQRAGRNASANQLELAEFRKHDLHSDSVASLQTAGECNKLLLDPPRSGAREVVSLLVPKIKPEKIVYVSCNPATLARDAAILVHENGYTLTNAGAIDMFPHTAHVEAMAVFSRS